MAPSRGKGLQGGGSLSRKAQGLMLRECLFAAGSRVLVMVSGGQDSLALLDILCGLAGRAGGPAAVHALHVNHHLRGRESDDDEAVVVRACGERGVGLTVAHRPVGKTGGNIQQRARDARREAALQTAAEHKCERIALGHTADDQAETMLYRLGRYGGLAAFRAMPPCEPPWVRPLLEVRRAETESYCRERGIEFAVDRGNDHPDYARTALRKVVLPAWEAALPGAVEAAARSAEVAAEMESLADQLLGEVERSVVVRRPAAAAPDAVAREPGGAAGEAAAPRVVHPAPHTAPPPAVLNVPALVALEAPLRRLFLYRWLADCSGPAVSRASVLALESLLSLPGTAERDLRGGWHGVKVYDELYLRHGGPPARPQPAPVRLTLLGRAVWGPVWVAAEPAEHFLAPDIASEAFVDARVVQGALEVRGPRPGDRIRPLGAPGTRKLQDVLVDLRIPAMDRAVQPLVVCDGRIVWVCGLLVAEEGRITKDTTGIVRLSMGPAED